jgi:ferredoxin
MQLQADLSKCEGHANCVMRAPDFFALDDSDRVVILDDHPGEEARSSVVAAVRACPVDALTLS